MLRAGSSGSPNDLLRYLVTHDHLIPLTNIQLVDMIELLLSLGITEPDLYWKVQNYFPETRKNIQIKADAAILGNYVCYSVNTEIKAIKNLYTHNICSC